VAVPYLEDQPGPGSRHNPLCAEHLTGLRGAASDWSEYENGRRLITLAFRARDGSLQPYQVRLPERWDAAKSYPLIVDLHGAGNPDTLGFVAQGFGADKAAARSADAADKMPSCCCRGAGATWDIKGLRGRTSGAPLMMPPVG
jgi:hypothetical protein